MLTYTVHDPLKRLRVASYKRLANAFRRAYTYLPLDTPGHYNPDGKYVIVQEWADGGNPLRQWIISGRQAC